MLVGVSFFPFSSQLLKENGGNIMRHLDGLLAQSNDLIKQMEIEVRTQDPATKKVLNEKVQQYKKSLTSIRTDYERAKADADRANLIDSRSGSDRERFLKTNDKYVSFLLFPSHSFSFFLPSQNQSSKRSNPKCNKDSC
jgi:hypothetical protein